METGSEQEDNNGLGQEEGEKEEKEEDEKGEEYTVQYRDGEGVFDQFRF